MSLGQDGHRLLAEPLHRAGLLQWYRERAFRGQGAVLMYHRVVDATRVDPGLDPGMFVTGGSFARHLELLTRTHALVTMEAFGDWLNGRVSYSRPPCALTFDDGWADNYTVAFPLLRRFGVPATIFLITGSVGDREMMNWDQIAEMEDARVTFGSHTVTHALLGTCDAQTIRRELAVSKDTLDQHLKRPSRWFCFPKGSHSDLSCQLAREYYDGAVTTQAGWAAPGDDPYRLRRIGIHEDMTGTAALFSWRLSQFR